jgi:hypothetical protein
MSRWLPDDPPHRVHVGDVEFVALSPALLDADYAAVMRDIPMLRAWSNQDWPTPEFTKEENLVDLVRHDREQQEGLALTYSVLVDERVVGCVYVREFTDSLATRDVANDALPSVPRTDAVARGWAHELAPEALITATFALLRGAPFSFTRLWWQSNEACPEQLSACDELGLEHTVAVPAAGTTWVLRTMAE